MLDESVRIAALLLFWAVVSLFGVLVRNIGDSSSIFVGVGRTMILIAAVTGLASVLLYVLARGIALGRSEEFGADRSVQ